MRYNGALNTPMVQRVPIDMAEPRVRLDRSSTALNVAEALGCVDCAQSADQVAGFRGHGRGVADAAFDNSVFKNSRVSGLEKPSPNQIGKKKKGRTVHKSA